MNKPADRLKSLLGTQTVSAGPEAFESTGGVVNPTEILDRVEDTLNRMPPDEVGDPQEFQRALDILLKHARTGFNELRNTGEFTSANPRIAMEAVIIADGSRPSLLIKKGTLDPDHPMVRDWKPSLTQDLPGLEKRIAAVGRIEPIQASANDFFGTGWLVKSDGLVLTNLHVLEAMQNRLSNAILPNGKGGFKFLGDSAFIDFIAESNSLDHRRFKIVEGTPSGIDGPGYARLDVAALKIVPFDEATLPEPIPVIPDIAGPQGELQSFCVIGYPGPPPYSSGVHDGVDWIKVNATLFGGRFGVKRLAPGKSRKSLGSVSGDTQNWVFGHDATTLGGSSGSAIIAWLDDTKGGFGLHFAGTTIDSNYAHALGRVEDQLTKLGVPFVQT